MTPLITLLTDFGLEDPYVGVMKAALYAHCPSARIVDLTHALPPGDRIGAAFWLERVFSCFPTGTVHVGVVDPGVGTVRQALLVSAHGQFFVGPDNGVLSSVVAGDASAIVRVIDAQALGLPSASRTFHGRDVFAPVAARLAQGSLSFEQVGPLASAWCPVIVPGVVEGDGCWSGQIVTVDRFGNALSNLLRPKVGVRFEVQVLGRRLPVLETYGDAGIGDVFGLFGSFGCLEIAVRDGHAARALGLAQGTPLELYGVG